MSVAVVVPVAVKFSPMERPDTESLTLPNAYRILCLKVLLAGVMVIVTLLPIVTEVADRVGVVALGIVVSAKVPEALALPEVYV